MPVGGRVSGKIGIITSSQTGTCGLLQHQSTVIQSGSKRVLSGSVKQDNDFSRKRPPITRKETAGAAGGNHSRINEEIIWLSVGMGITIAVLITIALCYILREKYRKHEEYTVTT